MPSLSIEFSVWTNHVLDKYVAHELSQLVECQAEEIEEPKNYMGSFILNSIFKIKFSDENRAFVINYIRRVDQAVREYRAGRDLLIKLIEEKNSKPSLYFRTLHCFEQSIALLYQAMQLTQKHGQSITKEKYNIFEKGDNSKEERLNSIYNSWKHTYDRIAKGDLPPGGTMPVWITNEGMKSNKALLRFSELRELLAEYVELAKDLSEEWPKVIAARHEASRSPGER